MDGCSKSMYLENSFYFVGVGAAWRTANVEAGSTVAIFGLGSIGLAVWPYIYIIRTTGAVIFLLLT